MAKFSGVKWGHSTLFDFYRQSLVSAPCHDSHGSSFPVPSTTSSPGATAGKKFSTIFLSFPSSLL